MNAIDVLKRFRILFLLVAFPMLFGQVSAQSASSRIVDNSFNGWYFYVGSYRLSERWGLYNEFHFRRANVITDWQQFLFRPAVEFFAGDGVTLSAGYTYISSWPYGEQPLPIRIPENNVWEQVLLTHKAGKVNIAHRLRQEHRWSGNAVLNDQSEWELDGSTFKNRFRYRITLNIPLAELNAEKETSLFLVLFDEAWVNQFDDLMPRSFDQNWIYGALGWKFNRNMNVQAGMLHQWIAKSDGVRYESNPCLQLGLFWSPDFRKK